MSLSDAISFKNFMKPVILIILLVTLVLSAVFLLTRTPHSADSHGNTPVVLKVGKTVPDFELTSLDHQKSKLSDHLKHLTVINFWATWCPPCLEEIPSFIRLKKKYESRPFSFVLINMEPNGAEIAPSILKDLGVDFNSFYDGDQKLGDLFNVTGLPLTVILNDKLEILYFEQGNREWDAQDVIDQMELWLNTKENRS